MFEMGSHHPFGHLKDKLWPKEKPGVKLPICLPTTKCKKLTRFRCMQVACDILLENFRQRLQLCFRPHLNRRSAHKVMAPQSHGSPNLRNFRSPGTKNHLDVGLVGSHKIYQKGEGGGFPQVWAVVDLVGSNLPVARPNTKSVSTMH